MKKWMLRQGIKTRHRMMIGVAINSLIILGLTAYYFFQTSTLLTTIINAERIHNIKYHTGIELFYRFLNTGDGSLLATGLAELDSANHLAKTFSRSAIILRNYSKEALADSLLNAVPDAFDHKRSNAIQMVSRLKLLIAIGDKHIEKNFTISAEGSKLGSEIKNIIVNSASHPDQFQTEQFEKANNRMALFFHDFALEISDLIDYSRLMLVVGIIVVVILLGALTIMLTLFISNTISNPVLKVVGNIKNISTGDLTQKIEIENRDEIGQLAHAANEMIDNLSSITRQANIIATGDYT
ncbi:MAG: HAMP domain-containing protein, partial [Bacteroidetes bacterium]|nr:HAMP domain-containing protein [Bacteroidota bacterium]